MRFSATVTMSEHWSWRDAKTANPNDFQASLLLARLLAKQDPVGAEKELREAVVAVPLDPVRWSEMVGLFTLTKQWGKAEQAVQDAEKALKGNPLGLARCCEELGRAYKTAGQNDQKPKDWLDRAGRWYSKAHNDQSNDLNVFRQYIDFLVRRAVLSREVHDWQAARAQCKRFLESTRNTKDPEILKRRPDYIAQLVEVLFRLYQSDQSPELLNEAQDLIGELKALRPDAFNVLVLQATLYKAQNQVGKAIELIQATAKRPDLSDSGARLLASLADQLGESKLTEELLRDSVKKSASPQNRLALAGFLSRHGRVKEALDQWEPLWIADNQPRGAGQGYNGSAFFF